MPIKYSCIASRLSLFYSNLKAMMTDPLVLECVQVQTQWSQSINLIIQLPTWSVFSQRRKQRIDILKVLSKPHQRLRTSKQAAKGFHSQLFCVPKKAMKKTLNTHVESKCRIGVSWCVHMLRDTWSNDWIHNLLYFMFLMTASQRP